MILANLSVPTPGYPTIRKSDVPPSLPSLLPLPVPYSISSSASLSTFLLLYLAIRSYRFHSSYFSLFSLLLLLTSLPRFPRPICYPSAVRAYYAIFPIPILFLFRLLPSCPLLPPPPFLLFCFFAINHSHIVSHLPPLPPPIAFPFPLSILPLLQLRKLCILLSLFIVFSLHLDPSSAV